MAGCYLTGTARSYRRYRFVSFTLLTIDRRAGRPSRRGLANGPRYKWIQMTVAEPRPASTVVLVRPSTARFEVFLVRRSDSIAFMGGAHVFPGGRVDPADHIDHIDTTIDGMTGAAARMPDLPAEAAIAHHVAALRELFEEAGLLLARPLTATSLD